MRIGNNAMSLYADFHIVINQVLKANDFTDLYNDKSVFEIFERFLLGDPTKP